jgi:hypothetical protein
MMVVLTETQKFQRELAKIDRRIQDDRISPEQKQELWRRRRELFESKETEDLD